MLEVITISKTRGMKKKTQHKEMLDNLNFHRFKVLIDLRLK